MHLQLYSTNPQSASGIDETNPGRRTPECPCHSLYTSFVTGGTLPSRLHSRGGLLCSSQSQHFASFLPHRPRPPWHFLLISWLGALRTKNKSSITQNDMSRLILLTKSTSACRHKIARQQTSPECAIRQASNWLPILRHKIKHSITRIKNELCHDLQQRLPDFADVCYILPGERG